jgi:hypothetical protein
MPNSDPSDELMEGHEIRQVQQRMAVIGIACESIDWERYLRTVAHAETIAPFIDPTSYIRSPHDARHTTNEMARLMVKYAKLYKQAQAEIRKWAELG